ncbi:MAG: DUF1737 domain-containing protein [Selenomonadaceae bacterium]|jgi:Uncharacterized conserved small protein
MNQKLRYRLITGKDDASFCSRISALLDEGYVLYGSPALTYNGEHVVAAQALILGQKESAIAAQTDEA